jgi:superfamily I DNA and/or RNA helicase
MNFFVKNKCSLLKEITDCMSKVKEKNDKIDILECEYLSRVIRDDDIIAMTTTGAAKNKKILEGIKSKITIVEEAGEVLESHIIASFTSSTEHLILIGDHEQLRPRVNDFMTARNSHFNISLFERLINNKISKVEILTQRRMRPEISSITRFLYPALTDSPMVLKRPRLIGFKKDLFFFNHKWLEVVDEDGESKKNPIEADFICKFAEYLVQNNYQKSKITIISMYSSQLLYLQKKVQSNKLLKGIKVATADSFQGLENDIILLSFVRSNTFNNIGFLRDSHRLNVSLSRARNILYMFGNIDCIRTDLERSVHDKSKEDKKSKNFWLATIDYLNKMKMIGEALNFTCPNHKTKIKISCVENFERLPLGGCGIMTENPLLCGHTFLMTCHNTYFMMQDEDYPLNKPCELECIRHHGCIHPCRRKCSDFSTE